MRSIPILIVSMGLFLACTSKPERPRLEIPDAGPTPPTLTCQESCDSNDDCGQGTTDGDGGVITPPGKCCLADGCGAKNRCVECLANSDCAEGVCLSGSCVGCADDGDCAGNDLGGVCNVIDEASGAPLAGNAPLNSCITCTDDSMCGGGASRCNTYGQCSCADKGQCADNEICRDEGCVCGDDSACPTGAKKCVPGAGVCVACAEDEDCTDSAPKCFNPDSPLTAYCGCTSNDQCEDGTLCNESGKCVACLANADCAGNPGGSVCTPTGSCGQCANDEDCGEGTCTAGVCACTSAGDCKSATATPDLKWVCE